MNNNFSKFGRSGCSFRLDENGIILRKISSGLDYNSRLYSQYLKQCNFENNNNFSTPRQYVFDKTSELHYFDMEYIYGKTFNAFCLESNVSEILSFCDNLQNFLSNNIKKSILTEINFEKLEKKLIYLSSILDVDLKIYINFLLNNQVESLLIGESHGDLTMSNIMFSDKYYLIDFLDNPYETPLNDLIKIKFVLNLPSLYSNGIGLWCNGNTTVFGAVFLGSSPSRPTKKTPQEIGEFCIFRNIS